MRVDLVFLPTWLTDVHVQGRAIAVFDVLRATTTMTAALVVGVSEIRVFATTAAASAAAGPPSPTRLLAGEENTLPPTGFDLGNSPGDLNAAHAGRVMHMSTTNGTRAIVAARKASVVYIAALVNARAAAGALARGGLDVTLVCSGTAGAVSLEDVIGAGAVLEALDAEGVQVEHPTDEPLVARNLFRSVRHDLRGALGTSRGARNITKVQLVPDIDFCARLDVFDVVGVIEDPSAEPPVVRRRVGGDA